MREVTFVGRGIFTSLTFITLGAIVSGFCSLSSILVTGNGNLPMTKGIGYATCLSFLFMNLSGSERGEDNSRSLSCFEYQPTYNNEM